MFLCERVCFTIRNLVASIQQVVWTNWVSLLASDWLRPRSSYSHGRINLRGARGLNWAAGPPVSHPSVCGLLCGNNFNGAVVLHESTVSAETMEEVKPGFDTGPLDEVIKQDPL